MSTFTEQISAVRKSQVEAQLNFFQNFAARAVESTQKILALNLSVSRASLEKSTAAMADLLTAKDPRDLFALTNRTQENINTILAYNRELVAIATGAGAAAAETVTTAATATAAVAAETQDDARQEYALVKAALEESFDPAPAEAEFVAPVAEPEATPVKLEVKATPAAPPEAKATPIAKAASKVASKAVAAKPAAAPAATVSPTPVVVTNLKAVEAAPPPAPVSGKPAIAQQQLNLSAGKTKKKK